LGRSIGTHGTNLAININQWQEKFRKIQITKEHFSDRAYALGESQNSGFDRFVYRLADIRQNILRICAENILEATQKGSLDITRWLQWFLACLDGALNQAEETLTTVLAKTRFWERINDKPLNERQRSVLNRLLDGFDGKLTSTKWARLAKCSIEITSLLSMVCVR